MGFRMQFRSSDLRCSFVRTLRFSDELVQVSGLGFWVKSGVPALGFRV